MTRAAEPHTASYIIISGSPGGKTTMEPTLATGPFGDIAAAVQFRDLLDRTVDGRHVVLALHTPTEAPES